jgi:hypothetical protein
MKLNFTQRFFYVFILMMFVTAANSQTPGISLFKNYKNLPASLEAYVSKGEIAAYDFLSATKLISSQPATLNFSFQFENKEWIIELTKSDLFSKGFFASTGSNPKDKFKYDKQQALYYHGKIQGKPRSFAAVSIIADKIMAVIADEQGNINIGAINTPEATQTNEHIIYREKDLLIKNNFECGAVANEAANSNPLPVYTPSSVTSTTINAEPLDIYFEADFTTYVNNGFNTLNVLNYMIGLFNIVHTLYESDSINTKISGIKVWDIADPYIITNTTAEALNAFAMNMNGGFPGDIAHLLSQRSLGGGRAYQDILCNSSYFKTGVSGNLTNSFSPLPVYSWSTMVITHETGHNIGSPHTQSCNWPGGAIDNCTTTEGGCAPGPAPLNGGTMMSYCHLSSWGINFANGFGPLPGQLIRNRVRGNNCLNPEIDFETTYQNVQEENTTVENNCLDYTLLTTQLKIPYAPSKPANITLTPSGSAGLVTGTNKDVEISPLSFTIDSSNLSQTIYIKVYNDAIIENTESLLLNFTVNANGGNAVKKNFGTTYTLSIADTDHKPDSTSGLNVFYESFDNISSGFGNWVQTVIYGNSSPNRWMVGNSRESLFPSGAAFISNNQNNYAYTDSTIADSCIVRLTSRMINANGFSNMHISYVYQCAGEYSFVQSGGTGNGESLIGKDFGRLLYSTDGGLNWLVLKDNISGRYGRLTEDIALPEAANNSSQLKIAFEWHNNSSITNNPPLLIDSIVINGASTCNIQTLADVDNNNDGYLGPFQTVHYYNPVTNNIMASIQNTSSFDFGCTRVQMLRAGNGASAAWDSTAASKISRKAFKITADNNDAAAPYLLTLYYTADEITSWTAATGNKVEDLQIVKTTGNILSTANTSPAVFSSINSVNNYGATPHKTHSAAFTGFGSTVCKTQLPCC